MNLLFLVLLILVLLAVLPAWPYSSGWGYVPRADKPDQCIAVPLRLVGVPWINQRVHLGGPCCRGRGWPRRAACAHQRTKPESAHEAERI